MNITVFTANQPRHLALIKRLASVSSKTFAIMECNTVFPGLVADFFKKSPVMQNYFSNVMHSEKKLFGDISFLPGNAFSLSLKSGDLNLLPRTAISNALESDIYIVFGASYIKGWLIDFLVERGAYNIHMGISPYYRGSSCNFWALYDERPGYVGATIHLLSKGLDSGPILYHALPRFHNDAPFDFTMRAVEAAQRSLVEHVSAKDLSTLAPVLQDRNAEIRYTRNADFTDQVAASFLTRSMTSRDLGSLLSMAASPPALLHPYFA